MNRTSNRRDFVRFPALENRAILAWNVNGAFAEDAVRLVNISQSGALCVCERGLPADLNVWIRLVEPTTLNWVEAAVVGSAERGPTPLYQVRLRFLLTPCPYDFYRTAISGRQAVEP